ncbi:MULTISPECIES: response regulator transcription factor [Actinoplanes]|uniref:response regulator transcription factor n=1 Tax=Actinoplanes TaxID=1865 RepID=UPI0005F2EAA4|nr:MULTISPECIES: response regulator transcription factor [Actinoplanes]GLY07801.1 DNA-binding response regulator [Actinoplanes sp. NBRC 101535]
MRVALAEDNPIFRSSLALLLGTLDIDVVLAVGDGPSLLTGIAADPPDVVILDARMPPSGDEEGFRVAERVHRVHERVGILLFSDYQFFAYARRLVERIPRGVGYLIKDRVRDDEVLKDAIVRVAAGDVVLDDVIAQRISAAAPGELSPTEREVLRHVASGLSNHAVATVMFSSDAAVERHLTSIFRKLGLPSDPGHNRRVLAILQWLDAQRP